MNILITGAAGFIGYHTCKNILIKNKKAKIFGVDNINDYYNQKLKRDRIKSLKNDYNKNKKFYFLKQNIADLNNMEKIFKKHKISHVINLAAQAGVRYSLKDPFSYVENNLVGFHNILYLSKKYKIKHLVYASSSSVYGNQKKQPYKENFNTDNPIQFYAATKKSNEIMAVAYSNLYKMKTTGLRFFTVYGPWGRPDMALFKFTKNILLNKKIEVFNKGNHSRDFTYIDDIVMGIIKVLYNNDKKKLSNILNIGRGKKEKLLTYIKCIEKYLNKKSKMKLLGLQKGDIKETNSSTDKINKLVGYKPKTNIEVGIKNFLDWYLSYYKIKIK